MYEKLLIEYNHIPIREAYLEFGFQGLYKNGRILIEKRLSYLEKGCVLSEEIGHNETSCGNIIDQSSISNRKQELRARQWGYCKLIPLERIIDVYKARIQGRYEIAEYLGVTEEFLQLSIDRYTDIFGKFTRLGNFIIHFEPLGVTEFFEN